MQLTTLAVTHTYTHRGAFTILGVVLVTQPGCFHQLTVRDFAPEESKGVLLAILAATCNAGAFVSIRLLKGAQTTLALTWWYHLVSLAAVQLCMPATPFFSLSIFLACTKRVSLPV